MLYSAQFYTQSERLMSSTLDPLEYTIECELVALTIGAQVAKAAFLRLATRQYQRRESQPDPDTLLELVVDSG